jgi:hypothetical protein
MLSPAQLELFSSPENRLKDAIRALLERGMARTLVLHESGDICDEDLLITTNAYTFILDELTGEDDVCELYAENQIGLFDGLTDE